MFVEYIYIYIYIYNNTAPKRHAETLQNWNIPFQLKKQNTYRNGIDNLGVDTNSSYLSLPAAPCGNISISHFRAVWDCV